MKFSYRPRLALIALLLVLSTLFASCNFLPANNAVTNPVETTTAETTPIDDSKDESTPSPEESTPEEITPEETTPEVTTPKVTSPEVTTPEVTTPEVTSPEVTTPEVTTPEVTTPEVTTPEVTTPEVTTPEVTTPEVTTPEVTTPAEKIEYTVSVKTIGGRPLQNLTFSIYKGATPVAYGETDNNGIGTVELEVSDNYSIQLDTSALEGYSVEDRYTFVANGADIILASSVIADSNLTGVKYQLGDVIRDFSCLTTDGKTFTLSEVLETKKAVLINFWYTSCAYCRMEFPYLQSAYEKYQDDVEVIALNDVYFDNEAAVKAFKEEMGLTFPVAKSDSALGIAFDLVGYPTSIMIDRYGTICLIQIGAALGEETFVNAFDYFAADNYEQKFFNSIDDIPPAPSVPEVTTPEVTTPEITTPETTTPEETIPEETIPEITTPGEHYPGIPAFSGEKYVEINGNVPYFTEKDYTTTSYESYAVLDSLGRCGIAMACLGRDLMPTGTRGDLSTNPSGWMQASYDIVDGRYLYNRSHLIGWQLAGEDDNKLNLITGTRFCNQLGMLPFENMVADYIKETNNHVLYRVTPLFIGNELVARGVLMEAWSVEDNGDGICFNVFIYNAQPGIIIDYATGSSRLEKEDTTTPDEAPQYDYVANKNSKKFHYPECSSVDQMSEKNKEYHTATHDEMIQMGYIPCANCNP